METLSTNDIMEVTIDLRNAAKILGVSMETLRTRTKDGMIISLKKHGYSYSLPYILGIAPHIDAIKYSARKWQELPPITQKKEDMNEKVKELNDICYQQLLNAVQNDKGAMTVYSHRRLIPLLPQELRARAEGMLEAVDPL